MTGLEWLAAVGVALVAIGLGLWWLPAALIWAGLAMIAAAFLTGYSNGHHS